MTALSESIERLATELARMPGVGIRTAERLAYYIQTLSADEAGRLVEAIRDVKARSRACSTCSNITEADPCPICADASRDRTTVCVVERVRDLAAVEAATSYRGLYHVLGGRIAPLEGVHPEHLSIERLVERVKREGIKEIILATNPDTEGDATAHFIADRLAPLSVTITRIARGMPAGGQLEHAAKGSVAGAFQARQRVKG